MAQQVKQADSLWINFDLENWASIYPTWDTTWTGTFEISATETSTPIYTGSLTRSTISGQFQLRLNTDSASTSPVLTWAAVPVGTYLLMTQFSNSTAKYREENHEKLTIKVQGL
jgi:hypothetical protein